MEGMPTSSSNLSGAIKKLIIPVGIVLILIAFAIIYGCGSGKKVDLNHFKASGEVLGDEVAKSLGKKGKVLIITRDQKSASLEAFKVQQEALISSLKKNGITISEIEFAPQEQDENGKHKQGLPGPFFTVEIQKDPTVTGVISLAGVPAVLENFKPFEGYPKVFVFSLEEADVENLLNEKILELVILPNPNQTKLNKKLKTTQEYFDHYFVIERAK
jgi:hypothetical protein